MPDNLEIRMLTSSDIFSNSFVVTGGGVRLAQFRRCLDAVGLDGSLPKEWKWCKIEGEGSLGNAIAQYSLVRHALEAKMPFLVVFEDDAVPCDGAGEKLVKAFEERDPSTLCLSLGWSYDSDPEKGDDRCAKRRVYGSHAYALFGEKAYLAYMDAWERNGRADVVLGMIDGSRLCKENLFAQHTVGESIHLPAGWTIDADVERQVDAECAVRFSKARSEVARMAAERTMHIAYTIDVQGSGAVQFVDQLVVSVYTLRQSMARDDRIVVHILYANVPADLMHRINDFQTDKFKVEWKKIKSKDLEYMQTLTKHDPKSASRSWGGIVFCRLWLPLALPNVSRVIYTDADTLFRASVKPLWETDLNGNFIACPKGTVYEYGFYTGLMVMDCDAMRKSGQEEDLWVRLGDFLEQNSKKYMLPDQTSVNEFFKGSITELDRKWCYPPTPGKSDKEGMNSAAIWHFYEGGKPTRLGTDDFSRGCLKWNSVLAESEGRKFVP